MLPLDITHQEQQTKSKRMSDMTHQQLLNKIEQENQEELLIEKQRETNIVMIQVFLAKGG